MYPKDLMKISAIAFSSLKKLDLIFLLRFLNFFNHWVQDIARFSFADWILSRATSFSSWGEIMERVEENVLNWKIVQGIKTT